MGRLITAVASRIQESLGAKEQRDAMAYLLGTLLQRLGLLLVLPLLLRSLTVAEYGAFGLVQSAMTLLPAVLTLNVPATVTRLYFDESGDEGRKGIAAKLTVLCLAIGVAATLIGVGIAVPVRKMVAHVLGVTGDVAFLISGLVLVGALGSAMFQMGYGIWRAQQHAVRAATAAVFGSLLFLVVGIALDVAGHLDLVNTVMAYACSTLVIGLGVSLLATSWAYYFRGPTIKALCRTAVSYGLPVLPYLLGLWALAAGGRWIGRATLGLEGVAQFTLASQIAIVVALVGRSSYEAWAPRSFALVAAGRRDDARVYLRLKARRILVITVLAAIVAELAIALFLPSFAPSYAFVVWLFPAMALGSLFDVAYLLPHNVLLGIKRTRPIARYTTISVCSFALLGIVLSHHAGLWGLVAAYVFAYFLQWAQATRAAAVAVEEMRPEEGPEIVSDTRLSSD